MRSRNVCSTATPEAAAGASSGSTPSRSMVRAR
jgi:hypothetical protein